MTDAEIKQKIQSVCNVSRETIQKLELYADLLERWNLKINLVSKTTLPDKWERHFLDSAQVWPLIPSGVQTLADIGSGAGFAGLVLAIIAAEKRPGLKLTMIESDARKCAFMRNVSRETGVNAEILTERIENVQNIHADLVTARALATVSQLLTLSSGILKENGSCLFLKGDACAIEIEQARESWVFDATETPSITHPSGRVLHLTGIKRAG